ncbi:glycine cleavage system H protein [Ascobolus immersus RN42]|uniref:Glycine cleavage system H protein n=1 Tax=Ascobolus immersus RN42 TaxID=1160509 RepID=A0A3N4HLQ3_ASCIM|nr:glycine cleavage system H protein [Ascobolus immersus RN42]
MASLFARSAVRVGRNVMPVMSKRAFSASAGRFEVIKKYTKDHEWVSYDTDSKIATIGITTYAASALGDVVYVELETPGTALTEGSSLGVVESVKSASDIYSPVSGEIVEANDALTDKPGLVNADAEGEAWMVKVATEGSELEALMDAEGYEGFKKEGAH